MERKGNNKIICKNKKAYFDYEITEKLEAGISLLGTEVKSIKTGNATLSNDSYVGFDGKGLLLFNFNVTPLKYTPIDKRHDPLRNKRLLAHKKEIIRLRSKIKLKGLTIVPLMIYIGKSGFIKIEIGLAKGKQLYDKRKDLKNKDLLRQSKKELKMMK